ncbi:MAG: hypothetical protein HYT78_03345 [Deltaproteobacteria bacterium]|nr:hypothetical protein [Deltaproteobacteria bacterium]
MLVSWETWPEDLGTPSSHQRSNRGRLPEKAVFKKDMGVVMDREYGERVGIWRLLDLFDMEGIKGTFFLNGKTVEENPDAAVDAFDYLYEEGATSPKMFTVSVHPYLSGRPYRAKVLRDFIRHAKSHPQVWFARGIDIAKWWREKYC